MNLILALSPADYAALAAALVTIIGAISAAAVAIIGAVKGNNTAAQVRHEEVIGKLGG